LSTWFALSGENFRQLKVWTLFSYGFLHSTLTIFHILGNMLGLFFIGRILEPLLGRQQFLLLYLGSMLVGGLTYLVFHVGDFRYVVGASAAVFGILTLFCFLRPEQPITLLLFFVLPITVKPKWLFRISLGITIACLLFYELPGANGGGVAHSAHLGGMISGVLYYRFVYLRGGAVFGRPGAAKPSVELPEWFKRRKRQPTARKINYTVNRSRSSRDELQKEVDRILDKINASGFGSLSDSEKQTLDHAKDILR
jgi:membrane associated rhomboid family serine protease